MHRNPRSRAIVPLAVLGLWLASCSAVPSLGAAPTSTPASPAPAPTGLIAEGRLFPRHVVDLSFDTGGTIAEVNTQVGDTLQANQVVAQLASSASHDTDEIRAQKAAAVALAQQNLIAAQEEVTNSQKALADLLAPAAVAVNQAQAQAHIADLQKQIDDANRNLGYLVSPDIRRLQENVAQAQNALTDARQNAALVDVSQLQAELLDAQKQLQTATNVYNNAKDAFARCPSCATVWAYDRTTNWADAQSLYTDAVNLVQQLQTQIDQSARGTSLGITTAQDNLRDATNQLNYYLKGPDAVKVNQAQADLALLKSQLAKAQTDAATLQQNGGVDADQLKAARDRVANAQAGLDAAQASLASAQASVSPDGVALRAPFAGTVAAQGLEVGELVSAGQTVVTLADLSQWEVQTDDLTEVEVVQVAVGQAVKITFDALPNVTLAGVVRTISPQYQKVNGDITYVVYVNLTDHDPRLRWGMTAKVEFAR